MPEQQMNPAARAVLKSYDDCRRRIDRLLYDLRGHDVKVIAAKNALDAAERERHQVAATCAQAQAEAAALADGFDKLTGGDNIGRHLRD